MDPLSDIVSMVTVEAAVTSRLEASGSWGLRFAAVPYAKFGVVHQGVCWIAAPDHPAVRLAAGDCYLFTAGGHYTMTSAADTPAETVEDAEARYAADAVDGWLRLGEVEDAPDVVVTGGRFVLNADHAALLLDLLPPVMAIYAGFKPAPALRAALDLLAAETAAGAQQPGGDLVRTHLAHIVITMALRAYAAGPDVRGWLAALTDPQLGSVLRAVHHNPAHPWTVRELAQRAHLARSTFAARFRELVGVPPLEYLLRLRMHHAVGLLRRPDASVTEVAERVGYASHSSFSHAFTRVMGAPPGRFRNGAAASEHA